MRIARRLFLFGLAAVEVGLPQTQDQSPSDNPLPPFPRRDRDRNDEKLPNGKSRADAIAEDEHRKALDEADQLLQMAQKLKDQLKEAGRFVVPMQAIRQTEDIEKLAKKIRSRLRT
jgi:hypothetical protein